MWKFALSMMLWIVACPVFSTTVSKAPDMKFASYSLGIDYEPVISDAIMGRSLLMTPDSPKRKLSDANYFAFGRKDIKIQASFVHQISRSFPLVIAYKIRGFWAQKEDSAPFRDINHHPELYWRFLWGDVGFEHESNGIDNESIDYQGRSQRSRSLQRLYARPFYQFGNWQLVAEASVPIYVLAVTDYHEYMGFFDLGIGYQVPLLQFMSFVRQGSKGGRVEADLSIDPLELFDVERRMDTYTWLFIQYFEGYAESLLDYDRRTRSLRFGLRFSS